MVGVADAYDPPPERERFVPMQWQPHPELRGKRPAARRARRRWLVELPMFIVIAYGLSWLAWLPGLIMAPERVWLYPFWQAAWAFCRNATPAMAAFLVTISLWGKRDVVALLRGIVRPRVGPGYYLLPLLIPALAPLAALWLHPDGRQPLSLQWPSPATIFWSLQIALGEEIGWRGYALPRAAQRLGWLGAALLVGVLWALWYLPQFLVPGTNLYGEPFPVFLLIIVLYDSTIFTCLYARTAGRRGGGALLPVILLRWAQGVWLEALPTPSDALLPAAAALVFVAGFAFVTMPRPLLRRGATDSEVMRPI